MVNKDRDIPPWQRWNDYGIGMFLKEKKAALRQATEAFAKVEEFGRFDGPLNLARVLLMEGQLDAPLKLCSERPLIKILQLRRGLWLASAG